MTQCHNGTMTQWHNDTTAQWHNDINKYPMNKERLRGANDDFYGQSKRVNGSKGTAEIHQGCNATSAKDSSHHLSVLSRIVSAADVNFDLFISLEMSSRVSTALSGCSSKTCNGGEREIHLIAYTASLLSSLSETCPASCDYQFSNMTS